MSAAVVLAVVVGGALGAPARFVTERTVVKHYGTSWPAGTFIVNMLGCLILGLVSGAALGLASAAESTSWQVFSALVGVGFCGALTTFSGFCAQILDLSKGPRAWVGVTYGLGSILLGFALAAGGYALTAAVVT